MANPPTKLYAQWLTSQKCPCGDKVAVVLADVSFVPVGLCGKCAMNPAVLPDRVAVAQLAGFFGLRRYPPVLDKDWYLDKQWDRRKKKSSLRNLWALLQDTRSPHVAAAFSFAVSSRNRVPASWLTPHQWAELLEIARQMYRVIGRKEHEPEQGDPGDSE
jgi:hypothetical protein